MCRHLAYIGRPTTLSALLLEPEHGLLRQSYAPTDMRSIARINADGFGAGWYPADAAGGAAGAGPIRYRSDRPIWSDSSFAALAAVTTTSAVLASVRAATPGMPVTVTACAPFSEGAWLFSHNGWVTGWPASLAELAAVLPMTDLLTLDAPTDAALLWALVRHRLRAGEDPTAALADVVREVGAAAPGSRLNLLLTDGVEVHATAWGHALSVQTEPDAVIVASEPTDRLPGWEAIEDAHLVTAAPGRCTTELLTTTTGVR